jgi:peptide/nickel transport system substrate-binding protein
VAETDPLGSMGLLRFNQLYPPFDNIKMRQAVLAVVDQAEYMTTLAGDPKDGRPAPRSSPAKRQWRATPAPPP